MKKQQSFTDLEYSMRKRKTKRDEFLETMDAITPWDEIVAMIEQYYYKNHRGRPANVTKIETKASSRKMPVIREKVTGIFYYKHNTARG